MPSATALEGIAWIAYTGADARTMGTDPRTSTGTVRRTTTALSGGEAAGINIAPTGESASALMANLLPQANSGPASTPQGVYVGEGLPPVPAKVAAKICRGDFVDMAELLPEFWALPRDEDEGKSEARSRWARSIQDIFTWLQCFGLYVSVLAPLYPESIAVIHYSQSKPGLRRIGLDALRLSLSKSSCPHGPSEVVSDQPHDLYPMLCRN